MTTKKGVKLGVQVDFELTYSAEEYERGREEGMFDSPEELAELMKARLSDLFSEKVYNDEEDFETYGFFTKERSLTVEPLEDAGV